MKLLTAHFNTKQLRDAAERYEFLMKYFPTQIAEILTSTQSHPPVPREQTDRKIDNLIHTGG